MTFCIFLYLLDQSDLRMSVYCLASYTIIERFLGTPDRLAGHKFVQRLNLSRTRPWLLLACLLTSSVRPRSCSLDLTFVCVRLDDDNDCKSMAHEIIKQIKNMSHRAPAAVVEDLCK